jgi:hypothetical protein
MYYNNYNSYMYLLSVVKVETIAVQVNNHQVAAARQALHRDVAREPVAAQGQDPKLRHELPKRVGDPFR